MPDNLVNDKFLKLIAAEVADHFDNTVNNWDLDEGDIRVIQRGPTSITLGLYKRDENGETTDEEISRTIISVSSVLTFLSVEAIAGTQ